MIGSWTCNIVLPLNVLLTSSWILSLSINSTFNVTFLEWRTQLPNICLYFSTLYFKGGFPHEVYHFTSFSVFILLRCIVKWVPNMASCWDPFIVYSLGVHGGSLEILHTHLVFIFLILLVYVEGTPSLRCSTLDDSNIPWVRVPHPLRSLLICTSIRLVELILAWKPRYCHQVLHTHLGIITRREHSPWDHH